MFDIGTPNLTSSICSSKFQRWCNSNDVTAGGVFKAANALQSYLALRCVVRHPSPNSAASIHSPALWRRAQSTTTPGSNVNLLQINIWLWTNYKAFFLHLHCGNKLQFYRTKKITEILWSVATILDCREMGLTECVKFYQFQCKITLGVCNSSGFTQIMRVMAFISRKIYTAGTNFTQPLFMTVATNLNSA